MKDLDFINGEKIAKAIDNRIVSVAKQVFNTAPMNKSKYGKVVSVGNGFYSVTIEGSTYTKVPALSNVGGIVRGDVVLCLIPNNQFSNITIVGVVGASYNTHRYDIIYNKDSNDISVNLKYPGGITNAEPVEKDLSKYNLLCVSSKYNDYYTTFWVDLTESGERIGMGVSGTTLDAYNNLGIISSKLVVASDRQSFTPYFENKWNGGYSDSYGYITNIRGYF